MINGVLIEPRLKPGQCLNYASSNKICTIPGQRRVKTASEVIYCNLTCLIREIMLLIFLGIVKERAKYRNCIDSTIWGTIRSEPGLCAVIRGQRDLVGWLFAKLAFKPQPGWEVGLLFTTAIKR